MKKLLLLVLMLSMVSSAFTIDINTRTKDGTGTVINSTDNRLWVTEDSTNTKNANANMRDGAGNTITSTNGMLNVNLPTTSAVTQSGTWTVAATKSGIWLVDAAQSGKWYVDTRGTTITNFADIRGNTFYVISDTKGTTITNFADIRGNTGFSKITDGTNTASVTPYGALYTNPLEFLETVTGEITSDASGNYSAGILTPTAGNNLEIYYISMGTDGTTGEITMSLTTSAKIIGKMYSSKSLNYITSPIHTDGLTNEPLLLVTTGIGNGKKVFYSITYHEE